MLARKPTDTPRPVSEAPVGTEAGTVAAGNDPRILGSLQARNNLSDLSSPLDARAALGLGSAAVLDRSDLAGPSEVARAVDSLRTELSAQLDQITTHLSRLTNLLQAHDVAIVHLQQTQLTTDHIANFVPMVPPHDIATVPSIGNGPAGIRQWAASVTPTINNLVLLLKSVGLAQ